MNAYTPLPALRIGTAGWSIPRVMGGLVGGDGTHLQRYSRVLPCAEINSSFHRPHAPATYAKWAEATPQDFRFAVKLPRTITHDHRLTRARAPLQRFLEESGGLGPRRGALLVQLPPSLAFESRVAGRFFTLLRTLHEGPVVCEPRHPTWFTPAADRLLVAHRVARVAADPAVVPDAARPGGWTELVYYRLHGSPRTYWSSYDDQVLEALASTFRVVRLQAETWCIFDNTASGAALANAIALRDRVT